MQMTTVTRWIDEKNSSLATVENLLDSEHPDEISENGNQYLNWKIQKMFDSDKTDTFYDRSITYNYYTFSVDQIPSGAETIDDGMYRKNGFVIVYLDSGKVRYIISRNTYAQTFLRKMLFYTGKGEIVASALNFTGDIFVWLISKVYEKDNIFSSENEALGDLTIDSIKGFKGDTEDFLAKVSVSGESVMNIISTLSFLVESRNLNQITIALSYLKHSNIEISLNNRNTLGFNDEEYLGELMQKKHEELVALCLLLLYTEILPIILQKYQSDIDSNFWGQGKCVSFLERVADDLSEKVSARINDLNAKPEQLKMRMIHENDLESDNKEKALELIDEVIKEAKK